MLTHYQIFSSFGGCPAPLGVLWLRFFYSSFSGISSINPTQSNCKFSTFAIFSSSLILFACISSLSFCLTKYIYINIFCLLFSIISPFSSRIFEYNPAIAFCFANFAIFLCKPYKLKMARLPHLATIDFY